jgi:putative FmdB family regulatory protein
MNMPIYEFFCSDCNTIFKFLSRSVNTDKKPSCPKCRKDILERRVSLFAAPGGAKESDDPMDNLPIDESKMESAMEKLAGEAENINEEDPRQAARLMQKFSDMTGLKYNDSIQEVLSRMEAGEDMENIESQMGDALDGEEPFIMPGKKGSSAARKPPHYDDTLYEM